MSVQFKANEVQVEPIYGSKQISVNVEVDDESDILEDIGIKTAIAHYGEDDLLDTIGKDKAMDYFQLVEEREE